MKGFGEGESSKRNEDKVTKKWQVENHARGEWRQRDGRDVHEDTTYELCMCFGVHVWNRRAMRGRVCKSVYVFDAAKMGLMLVGLQRVNRQTQR